MFVIKKEDDHVYPDQIELTGGLFFKVNERFGSKYPSPISVMGKAGLAFNLEWEAEFFRQDESDPFLFRYQIPFRGEDLLEETEVLDLTYLKKFSDIGFDSVNEYSWQITRLINHCLPDIQVYFLDPSLDYFDDIQGIYIDDLAKKNIPVFFSGHRISTDAMNCSVYSLMLSLTWCKRRHYNENYIHDATLLRIDFAHPVAGFGDLIRIAEAYLLMAEERGWIPMIVLDHENQYLDPMLKDAWSGFFAAPGIPEDTDLSHYRCWISVYENRQEETYSYANPYIGEFTIQKRGVFPSFALNEKTLEYVRSKLPSPFFEGANVLGIIVRTTDYERISGVTDVVKTVRDTRFFFDRSGYDYVFLATEDVRVLNLFREEFGSRLLYVDQKRVEYDFENNKYLIVSALMDKQYESTYQKGADYLSVIYALSGCRLIFYNHLCGIIYLTRMIRDRILDETYLTSFTSLQLVMLCDRQSEDRIILYGAGRRALNMLPLLIYAGKRILLCDRRAEKGEYEIQGCSVIAPETLGKIWQGELVVVTPELGKDEIKKSLIEMGINEERIYLF